MRKILVAALALLLAFPLASPAFAEDSPGAAAAEAGLVLPVDEGVPDDILEFLEENADDYIRSMRSLEPGLPSGEFTYGGGYLILSIKDEAAEMDEEDIEKIDSIFDIFEAESSGRTRYLFVGYIGGEPALVFQAVKYNGGEYYTTGTSVLSASYARALESAGFAILGCSGTKYATAPGTGEYATFAVDGSVEVMTLRSDPESPLPEDAVFSGSASAAPVYFEPADYAKHVSERALEARRANAEYRRERGYAEDEFLVSGYSADYSGFVPSHIVDVDALDSADGGVWLYAAAGAVVVACGAAALIYHKKRGARADR